ncbi:MAG: ABC transporter ATP-binding protein [Cognatishimia sp.]|nr:ABC transporter ATP-binding protein [Cognatishimia sp.]
MATLDLENISKSFGEVKVLHDIDLAIRDKEFVVFVGPSGCGKSTLLRIIAGLEESTEGKILIGGDNVSSAPPVERGISMVFQSYALYPHLSVYENIAFPLRVQKMAKDEMDRRVNKAAEILQLTDKLKLKPGQLSGGQRQRVAIGRSIVREPSVFLFDEPLSNLDAALRGDMRVELSQLHRDLDATMVYVTHDQVEAMTMADRIVVLNAGRVEQFGSPMELYHHPATKFVAGFIGQPNMNFVKAKITKIDDAGVAVDLDCGGGLVLPVNPGSAKVGDHVEVGIRPEDVSTGTDIALNVKVLERLGGVTIAYGALNDGTNFCASLEGVAAAKEGEDISLNVDPAGCHVFDANGKVLRRLNAPSIAG